MKKNEEILQELKLRRFIRKAIKLKQQNTKYKIQKYEKNKV